MTLSQQVPLDEKLLAYLLDHSAPLPPAITRALPRAAAAGHPTMQVAPDQGVLMGFLCRLIDARRVLEIGTFLGLSSAILADAVGPEGTVVCLDQSAEWTDQARVLWDEVGVAERIDLRLGDAHETLATMDPDERFDVVFIDADKPGYVDYLDRVTHRLRRGGLLMVDNTLWSGRIIDTDDASDSTMWLREFNRLLAAHPDYDVAIAAVGDGLTLARRL